MRSFAAVAALAYPAAAVGDGKKGQPVKDLMPWYHSGDEIKQELSDVSTRCGADMEITPGGADLDVIRIKKKETSTGTKAVLVFGEHARELISPESALDFVKNLCGDGASSEMARQTLDKGVEFVIVPNANPKGRKQVEDGYYCKRTNEDGVDLNRNWGNDHRWAKGNTPGDEMNPGPMGFSEPETQALRDIVDMERPDIYLSIHSGAYLLGSAYGYRYGESGDAQAVNDVLKPISEKYCASGCPYGGLADMIGYKSEGCDIDYVAEHSGVPYAFTWEIYVGEEIRKSYLAKARAQASGSDESDDLNLAQTGASRSKQRALRGRMQAGASLEARLGRAEDEEDPKNCIDQFLPKSKEETQSVVENWSGAYLDLASAVADRKAHPKSSGNATSNQTQPFAPTTTADPMSMYSSHYFDDDDAPPPSAKAVHAVGTAAAAEVPDVASPALTAETDARQAPGATDLASAEQAGADAWASRAAQFEGPAVAAPVAESDQPSESAPADTPEVKEANGELERMRMLFGR